MTNSKSLRWRRFLQMYLAALTMVVAYCDATYAADDDGSGQSSRPPNILWINAEDMSPHLGCYGHPDALTPNIDALSRMGIVYENAFATAPICSPARSCLATGLYATSLGTQHLRCEVDIPEQVAPLATRLRELGYFCTNSGKSDYNFDPDGIWNVWSSEEAPWRARKEGQPFFSFITVGETHEGRINFADRYEEAVRDLPQELRHDPESVTLPPFYPDTIEIRRLFARMHDLAMVFDRQVGRIVKRLEEDDELRNTVIFVFADHGNGLPRYKRWLNDSGLRVPLVVFVPPGYRSLSPLDGGTRTKRLVSFVDFPATALSLAGAEVPTILQGRPFLGSKISEPRRYVYGARSRADDMFEVSRSVFDGRFLYVKHFLPHLPYIQDSVIFDDRKESFRELRRLKQADELNEHAAKLWASSKPREELYDLVADPYELTNLANDREFGSRKEELALALQSWILAHRDSGFLTEAEYQIRAQDRNVTPYEVVQDEEAFDLGPTMTAAWQVGSTELDPAAIQNGLASDESGVRYWTVMRIQAAFELKPSLRTGSEIDNLLRTLVLALADSSPSVRIAAAQTMMGLMATNLDESADDGRESHSTFDEDVHEDQYEQAIRTLAVLIEDERPWVSLEASRAVALLGERAKPLVPVMKRVVNRNRSEPGSKRTYKDFNYASFIGWALETGLKACGEHEFVEAIAD